MKKNTLTYLAVFALFLFACKKQLKCTDFKNGEFVVSMTKHASNDSITAENQFFKNEKAYLVEHIIIQRQGNQQKEWILDSKKDSVFFLIQWMDECTYQIKIDNEKTDSIDPNLQYIDDYDGIVIHLTQVEDRCIHFTALMTLENRETLWKKGIQ